MYSELPLKNTVPLTNNFLFRELADLESLFPVLLKPKHVIPSGSMIPVIW